MNFELNFLIIYFYHDLRNCDIYDYISLTSYIKLILKHLVFFSNWTSMFKFLCLNLYQFKKLSHFNLNNEFINLVKFRNIVFFFKYEEKKITIINI